MIVIVIVTVIAPVTATAIVIVVIRGSKYAKADRGKFSASINTGL